MLMLISSVRADLPFSNKMKVITKQMVSVGRLIQRWRANLKRTQVRGPVFLQGTKYIKHSI